MLWSVFSHEWGDIFYGPDSADIYVYMFSLLLSDPPTKWEQHWDGVKKEKKFTSNKVDGLTKFALLKNKQKQSALHSTDEGLNYGSFFLRPGHRVNQSMKVVCSILIRSLFTFHSDASATTETAGLFALVTSVHSKLLTQTAVQLSHSSILACGIVCKSLPCYSPPAGSRVSDWANQTLVFTHCWFCAALNPDCLSLDCLTSYLPMDLLRFCISHKITIQLKNLIILMALWQMTPCTALFITWFDSVWLDSHTHAHA